MAKGKHTNDTLLGPDHAQAQHIHNAVASLLASLLAEYPETDRDKIAFEVYAAAYRHTGDAP